MRRVAALRGFFFLASCGAVRGLWWCVCRSVADVACHRLLSDYLFKLLLIGDSGVGKSCLLLRFAVSLMGAGRRRVVVRRVCARVGGISRVAACVGGAASLEFGCFCSWPRLGVGARDTYRMTIGSREMPAWVPRRGRGSESWWQFDDAEKRHERVRVSLALG